MVYTSHDVQVESSLRETKRRTTEKEKNESIYGSKGKLSSTACYTSKSGDRVTCRVVHRSNRR